jgi:hypothetical protein
MNEQVVSAIITLAGALLVGFLSFLAQRSANHNHDEIIRRDIENEQLRQAIRNIAADTGTLPAIPIATAPITLKPEDWDWLEPHLLLCEGHGVWMTRKPVSRETVFEETKTRFISETEMLRRVQPPTEPYTVAGEPCDCTDCKTTHDRVAFIERYGPE